MKFTDRYLRSLQPKTTVYDVREGNGFVARVFLSGKISFQYVYSLGGRLRRLTLGPYPALSLADARALHRKALDARLLGKDPAAGRGREVKTVEDLAKDYLEKWARPRKKSWKQDERILQVDVLPAIGHVRVTELHRRQVASMLETIERRAPNQAWQVLKILRRMFNFALEQSIGDIETNPCAHIKLTAERKSRERSLTVEEIVAFWHGMTRFNTSEPMQRALRTILITGQRPGEVLGMHRREIEGNWWTIPAERTKNKRPHRVYLSPLALEAIEDSKEWIFSYAEEPMQNTAAATAVRRMIVRKDGKGLAIEPFTPHDLRRTAATHLGALGYSNFFIGQILNHTDQSVTGIYNRYAYDREKQEMLERWAERLKEIIQTKGAGQS